VWDLSLDSTVCHADQHAAQARKPSDRGRNRREDSSANLSITGWDARVADETAKPLPAVEQDRKPMPIMITAGQRGDWPQIEPVLKKVCLPRTGPGRTRPAACPS
jgi:hypothetical protein